MGRLPYANRLLSFPHFFHSRNGDDSRDVDGYFRVPISKYILNRTQNIGFITLKSSADRKKFGDDSCNISVSAGNK